MPTEAQVLADFAFQSLFSAYGREKVSREDGLMAILDNCARFIEADAVVREARTGAGYTDTLRNSMTALGEALVRRVHEAGEPPIGVTILVTEKITPQEETRL